ncbi:hypothetical protein DFH08DRAFT_956795 [Mycena albidolilacea]|uniref:Uncharacterized protein n=1 Tax=Mycena albidolilacea TaxID=1033008 RepID=A0AAD7EVR3_9AGAR|nr:hypothetical protein DFH08DRAFT_956795 [Mycena albidolilacea]
MHDAPPSTWAGLSAGVAAWITALAPGARFDWRRDRGGMDIMHIEAPNRRLEVVAIRAISHFEIQGVDKYKFSECLPIRSCAVFAAVGAAGRSINSEITLANNNFTAMLPNTAIFNAEAHSVLQDTVPILLKLGIFGLSRRKTPLVTNFMDLNWQHSNPANPADA